MTDSMKEKAREFWILFNHCYNIDSVSEMEPDLLLKPNISTSIHVIEHSAYTAILSENEKMDIELGVNEITIDDLKEKIRGLEFELHSAEVDKTESKEFREIDQEILASYRIENERLERELAEMTVRYQRAWNLAVKFTEHP